MCQRRRHVSTAHARSDAHMKLTSLPTRDDFIQGWEMIHITKTNCSFDCSRFRHLSGFPRILREIKLLLLYVIIQIKMHILYYSKSGLV